MTKSELCIRNADFPNSLKLVRRCSKNDEVLKWKLFSASCSRFLLLMLSFRIFLLAQTGIKQTVACAVICALTPMWRHGKSSNELIWLHLKILNQNSSPINGHQGDMPYHYTGRFLSPISNRTPRNCWVWYYDISITRVDSKYNTVMQLARQLHWYNFC